jgi:hypothetical protein
MTHKHTFCSSPWIHMRINNSGSYEFCRWQTKLQGTLSLHNIHNESPLYFFQNSMKVYRKNLLEGQALSQCNLCYTAESSGKISGRQKQLLKTGIMMHHYEKSFLSSPLMSDFEHSANTNGHTLRTVSDWQIDLGNYCTGGCVMCDPSNSSRLATEFLKLNLIDNMPPRAWCDDAKMLQRFIDDLVQCTNLKYIHFMGGETLITPAFKKILQSLVDHGMTDLCVGFTTNLLEWKPDIIDLLGNFSQVHAGLSIETLSELNDYVRWPARSLETKKILDQWIEVAKQHSWLCQMRVTPTCLTAHELPTVYEFAWQHNIPVESCYFLERPIFLRPGVLPQQQRSHAISTIKTWLESKHIDETSEEQLVNTRNPGQARLQIIQDAKSFIRHLEIAKSESHLLSDLVQYLKRLESSRENKILDYIPQYESILKSAGY